MRPTPVELLHDLVAFSDVRLVVRNSSATAELVGPAVLREGPEWLTVQFEGRPDHVHLRRDALVRSAIVAEPGRARAVRFFGPADALVASVYVPGTAEGHADFSAGRLAAFDCLTVRHGLSIEVRSEEGSR